MRWEEEEWESSDTERPSRDPWAPTKTYVCLFIILLLLLLLLFCCSFVSFIHFLFVDIITAGDKQDNLDLDSKCIFSLFFFNFLLFFAIKQTSENIQNRNIVTKKWKKRKKRKRWQIKKSRGSRLPLIQVPTILWPILSPIKIIMKGIELAKDVSFPLLSLSFFLFTFQTRKIDFFHFYKLKMIPFLSFFSFLWFY